jgi:hypothetical protein
LGYQLGEECDLGKVVDIKSKKSNESSEAEFDKIIKVIDELLAELSK